MLCQFSYSVFQSVLLMLDKLGSTLICGPVSVAFFSMIINYFIKNYVDMRRDPVNIEICFMEFKIFINLI